MEAEVCLCHPEPQHRKQKFIVRHFASPLRLLSLNPIFTRLSCPLDVRRTRPEVEKENEGRASLTHIRDERARQVSLMLHFFTLLHGAPRTCLM